MLLEALCTHFRVNICSHMCSVGHTCRSGVAASHGNFMFNCLMNGQTASPSSWTTCTCHPRSVRATTSPRFRHACLCDRWDPGACDVVSHCGLVYVPQMAHDAEHLFRCLSIICRYLETCQLKSFANFLVRLFASVLLKHMSLFYQMHTLHCFLPFCVCVCVCVCTWGWQWGNSVYMGNTRISFGFFFFFFNLI